jgi:hypothetical protein
MNFFPGHVWVHLRDISTLKNTLKKSYKTQSLTWPKGPPVSWFPCMPHAGFLFPSLQIKSFWPLLLESVCAFILRVDPRTLNTWKSCVCHLCIIFRDHIGTPEVNAGCTKLENTAYEVTMIIQHSNGVCLPEETLLPWLSYNGPLRLTFSLSLFLRRFLPW